MNNKIIVFVIILLICIGAIIGIVLYNKLNKTKLENKEIITWKLENDKEIIETVNIEVIKEELDKVDTLESEHLVLKPSKSIGVTNYIQTYNDINVGNAKNENEKFHVEICFKDAKEGFKLIAKDNLTKEETTKIFIDYFENHIIPDVSTWYELEL